MKSKILKQKSAFIAILLFSFQVESVQYRCDGGYNHVGSNGSCLKAHRQGRNFHDAMGVCEGEGAKLALYVNEQELSDILSLFNIESAWIGMTDLANEGDWKFWNGKTPQILPWQPTEPNGGVNENCALLFFPKSMIADYPCDTQRFFICQRYLP